MGTWRKRFNKFRKLLSWTSLSPSNRFVEQRTYIIKSTYTSQSTYKIADHKSRQDTNPVGDFVVSR